MDPTDLDEVERLSTAAPVGIFVRTVYYPGIRGPVAHTNVANFGFADVDGRNGTAYVVGDRDAFDSRRARQSTAIAEADLVAWLLTHREELIRLARIGLAKEGDRG